MSPIGQRTIPQGKFSSWHTYNCGGVPQADPQVAPAGLVLRASKDLLQGEKLSTAVGKSAKTAAYGALAGMAFNYLTDDMIGHMASASEAEADAMMNGFEQANFDEAVSKAAADAGSPQRSFRRRNDA